MESEPPSKHHGAWCGAIGCKNSKNKQGHLSFHRFPSEPDRCRRWVQNSRRQDLIGKSAAYLHENVRICSDHFEASQRHEGSNRLKKDAVPTLFNVPNPPKRVELKRPLAVRCEPQPKQPKPGPTPSMDWSGLQWLDEESADKENSVPQEAEPSQQRQTQHVAPSSKKAAREVNRLRCTVRRLRLKYRRLERLRSEAPVQPTVASILNATSTILPPSAQSFLKMQLKLAKVKPRGRRYPDEEVVQALAIYYQGPRAYRQLAKRFVLPSPRILRKRLEGIRLDPGLHTQILQILQEKTRHAKDIDKLAVISFDEMQVKPKLTYLRGDDSVEGYEDLGELGRTFRMADHVMVFMVRGLTARWKQPIGYFYSRGPAPARVIEPLLVSAIRELRQVGLKIVATVCDMGTSNQDLYRQLGVTAEHPKFEVDGIAVNALHDVPHLMKCIRNALLKHKVDVDGERLSWSHIASFFNQDKDRPIRAAPKLTQAHITPDGFKKMSVKLATQVLSQSTAAGMLMYFAVGKLSAEIVPTANALMRLNNVFDVLNSCSPSHPNPYKQALSRRNERELTALLEDARAWIGRWKVDGRPIKTDSVGGLQMTITSILDIWTALRDDPLQFLLTRRLNQDGIENCFGTIRTCSNGANDVPDPTAFRAAYRKATVSRIITAPLTANCEEDGDHMLNIMTNVARRVNQPVPHSRVDLVRDPGVIGDVKVDMVTENCLRYVAGYLACKSDSDHRCDRCRRAMCTGERVAASQNAILTALRSFTGSASREDVGRLRQPTDMFYGVVRECYVVVQSQAPTMMLERGIARRLVECVLHSPEAVGLLQQVCSRTIVANTLARFVRLQLHVTCRRARPVKGGANKRNRKLLKVSQRL